VVVSWFFGDTLVFVCCLFGGCLGTDRFFFARCCMVVS